MPGFPRVWRLVCVLAVCLSGEIALGQAYEVTNLCEFDVCGAATSGVIQGGDGNFYGLAADGATGVSQLYRMTPVGVLTVIYTFTGTSTNPNSLILGTDGNFYGTTEFGGVNGEGSLFRITPGGSFTLLFSSSRAAGIHPQGMVQGVDGKLYLTTGSVTLGDTGSIASFDLTTGTVVLLHDLSYLAAIGPLVEGTDGNFYGAMTSLEGQGGVFKISPAGDYKLLFNLPQQYGQFQMWSPLVEGPDGNFYGWISYTYGLALTAIYKISPSGAGSLVHEFPSGATPANSTGPTSALTVGSDGKLYGEYYTVAPDYGDKPGELYFFSLTTEGSFEQTLVDENEYGANVTAFIQGTDGAFYSAGEGTIQRVGNGLGKPRDISGAGECNGEPGGDCSGRDGDADVECGERVWAVGEFMFWVGELERGAGCVGNEDDYGGDGG